MRWWGASVLAATGIMVACGSFGSDESDRPPPLAPIEAGVSDAGLDASFDAPTTAPTFCDTTGARVCTDFEDTVNPARRWDAVIDTPEPQGNGLLPVVQDSGDPARGKVYVTRFDPTEMSPANTLSRGAHHGPAGAWSVAIPARKFEVKLRVVRRVAIGEAVAVLGWNGDDGVPHAIFVECAGVGEKEGPCLLVAHRGIDDARTVEGVVVPIGQWTKLTVNLPPVTYVESGADDPRGVTVTAEVLGEPPKSTAVTFVTEARAPRKVRVDVGIGRLGPSTNAWEVWYDDLALWY